MLEPAVTKWKQDKSGRSLDIIRCPRNGVEYTQKLRDFMGVPTRVWILQS